jgi:hypothetical protein
LFVPPLAFLTLLCVNYGLEPWACEYQIRWPLHLTSALALGVVLGAGVLAWRGFTIAPEGAHEPGSEGARLRFLSAMGTMMSGLSALAVAALWITILILPPCVR